MENEEHIASQLTGLVGESEIILRQMLGNEQYDQLIRNNGEFTAAHLDRLKAEVRLLEARASLRSVVGGLLVLGSLWGMVVVSVRIWG